MNGGLNHNLNPVKYGAGSKYILLRAASREGYDFTGWFLDPQLTNKVEDKWLDVSEMSGTITLYAGWKAIEDDSGSKDVDDDSTGDNTENEGSEPGGDKNNPPADKETGTKTGDNFNLAIPAGLMAATICGAVAVLFGRKRKV